MGEKRLANITPWLKKWALGKKSLEDILIYLKKRRADDWRSRLDNGWMAWTPQWMGQNTKAEKCRDVWKHQADGMITMAATWGLVMQLLHLISGGIWGSQDRLVCQLSKAAMLGGAEVWKICVTSEWCRDVDREYTKRTVSLSCEVVSFPYLHSRCHYWDSSVTHTHT